MTLEPEGAVKKLGSFDGPSFDYESKFGGVELVRYTKGVMFFSEECIKGEEIQTSGPNIHFPGGVFSDIENGMNVMMDRYYVLQDMCEFLEVRFDFYPVEVEFRETIEMDKVRGMTISHVRQQMGVDRSKFGNMIGESEEAVEALEEMGTWSDEIAKSIRQEMVKYIGKLRASTKTQFKCWEKDIDKISEWTFNHDYYNHETGGHIAGYGANDSRTPMWSYSLITHNLEDVIRVMTESEAQDYFQQVD